MQAARKFADQLVAAGVTEVFTVAGTGSIHLDAAFAAHPRIKTISARHEAAAVLMATGASKLSNKPAVALVTSGPGAANALSGLVDAWADSVPVVVVSGQVEASAIDLRRRSFGIQGLDIVGLARGIAKFAELVRDPLELPRVVDEALSCAVSGRPGPVWLDLTTEAQALESGPSLPRCHAPAVQQRLAECAVRELLDRISAAERPVMLAGQGVRQAGVDNQFKELVRALGIPVVTSRLAYDMLPWMSQHHLGLGGMRGRPGAVSALREADHVTVMGCSLSDALVGSDWEAFSPDATVDIIDIDPHMMARRRHRLGTSYTADLATTIPAMLAQRSLPAQSAHLSWLEHCLASKFSCAPPCKRVPGRIDLYTFLERLDGALRPRSVVCIDTGSAFYASGQCFTFASGQREVTSSALVNMGAALPMAIGAAIRAGSVPVIAVIGDGAMEVNIQELRTVAQYNIDLKIFVVNNEGHASIRDAHSAICRGPALPDIPPVDFEAVAGAFLIPFARLDDVDRIPDQLVELLAKDGPILIEVPIPIDQILVKPNWFQASICSP